MADLTAILCGVLIPVGIFLLIVILAIVLQNKFIYNSRRPRRNLEENGHGFRNPKERNLDYEDIRIETEDGIKLHAWLIKDKIRSQSCATVVFFHGIDGNMGMRLQFVSFFQIICKVNILLVSYRGYGYSEGKPTEQGIRKDGEAVMKYIFERKDIDTSKIFLFGTSFGGAVAIYCASLEQYKLGGIIIENTFTSLDHILDRFIKLRCLRFIISRNHWRSINIIHKVRCPIFAITGMKDKLVPPKHSTKLLEAARNSKFKLKSEHPNGDHKSLWAENFDRYFKKIKEFILKSLQENGQIEVLVQENRIKPKPLMAKLQPKE